MVLADPIKRFRAQNQEITKTSVSTDGFSVKMQTPRKQFKRITDDYVKSGNH
jgi:hypothetical protein